MQGFQGIDEPIIILEVTQHLEKQIEHALLPEQFATNFAGMRQIAEDGQGELFQWVIVFHEAFQVWDDIELRCSLLSSLVDATVIVEDE
jgi:hypothetical protein